MIYFFFPQVQHGITPLSYRQDDVGEDQDRQHEDAEAGTENFRDSVHFSSR